MGEEAALWYEPIRQMQAPAIANRLGTSPIFRDDEHVCGLQAADMLAWSRRVLVEPFCTEEQRAFADSIVFEHATVEIDRTMLQSWAEQFKTVSGIEDAKGKRGSVRKTLAAVVGNVPSERLLPALDDLARRARRLRRVKALLQAVGLQRLWALLRKRKIWVR